MFISADQMGLSRYFPGVFCSTGISGSLYVAEVFELPLAQIHRCLQVVHYNLYPTKLGTPVKACDKVYTENLKNSLYY